MPKGRCSRFDYFFSISYMCNWGDDKKKPKAYEHHESTVYQHTEKYIKKLLKSPKLPNSQISGSAKAMLLQMDEVDIRSIHM